MEKMSNYKSIFYFVSKLLFKKINDHCVVDTYACVLNLILFPCGEDFRKCVGFGYFLKGVCSLLTQIFLRDYSKQFLNQ